MQFQADLAREAELGLNPHEVAFYDALADNETAVLELEDETLKKNSCWDYRASG